MVEKQSLFPQFVAYLSAIVLDDAVALNHIQLPSSLSQAVSHRLCEFVTGRLCAREALKMLKAPITSVPMGSDGSPQWPIGFVGSISHSSGFAFAAVANTSDAAGIGLDVEKLLSMELAQQLAPIIATPKEHDKFKLTTQNSGLLLSVLFSAKEAVYKCLYPIVLQRLEFEDVELDSIESSTFSCHLTRSLSETFISGMPMNGRFDIIHGMIRAGVILPRE